MKVSVYTSLARLNVASGVPRHITEVVSRLIHDPSIDLSFFVNEDEALKYLPKRGNDWSVAPRVTFSYPVRVMSRSWGLLNWPSFEALGGDSDWLYLPADGYVPVKKARLAVTIHDIYKLEPPVPGEQKLEHYRARLRHWVIYKRIAAHVDQILTVSKFSADRIKHYLDVPSSRIHIVHNGVGPVFFSPSEVVWNQLKHTLGIGQGQYFVSIGGLNAKKNGPGVIKAWKEFEKKFKDISIVILGHHQPSLLETAKRELKRAIFPEQLNDEEIAALLSHSIALFFPSYYEGFGIPVLEAFAAGTLAVLSNIPALREVGKDLAIYVDPEDINSMVNGLEISIKINNERNDRLNSGRDIARKYTWDDCAMRVREALR